MAKDGRPPGWLKHVNRAIIAMNRLGIVIENGAVLTVPGRRSGVARNTPVSVLRLDGDRYLLAGYPTAEWPRNVRAAGGLATLARGRRREAVRLVELERCRRGADPARCGPSASRRAPRSCSTRASCPTPARSRSRAWPGAAPCSGSSRPDRSQCDHGVVRVPGRAPLCECHAMATFLLLVAAGIGAGLSGSMAGLASLFSYPALLAAGLPAVAANVTNTVALTLSSVGAVAGSRQELSGQWPTVGRFALLTAVGRSGGGRVVAGDPAGRVREGRAGAGGGRRGGAAVPAADPRGRPARGGRRPPGWAGGARRPSSPWPSTAGTSAPPPG